VTLLIAETCTLRKANEALSKRRRAKKTRLCQERALIIEDTYNIIAQKEVDEQIRHDKRSGEAFSKEGNSGVQRCGTCRKTSYNTRTCQESKDISSLLDSEELELI
jgi:hypothetical protein